MLYLFVVYIFVVYIFRESSCCCACVTKTQARRDRNNNHQRQSVQPEEETRLDESDSDSEEDCVDYLGSDSEEKKDDCFPYMCTNEVYKDYDYAVISQFRKWRRRYTGNVMLETVELQEKIKHFTEMIEKERSQLSAMVDMHDDTLQTEIEQKRADISRLQRKLDRAKNDKRKKETFRLQGELLKDYVKMIRRSRIMKLVSFWQNIINYDLYVVFILNAFITGFGFANLPLNNQSQPVSNIVG